MRGFILGTILIVAGCNFQQGQQTKGELGRVSFAYTSGHGCFFGCGLETPMLRGTEETVHATGTSALLAASASAEPPGLVQIVDADARHLDEPGTAFHNFNISAIAAGDVQLSLKNDKGELIDRVLLKIRDAARLRAEWAIPVDTKNRPLKDEDFSSSSAVPLSGRDGCVALSAFDASGQRLQAANGFDVTVSDPSIVAVSFVLENYLLSLHPLKTGNATLTATAKSGVSTQLTVTTQSP